MRARMGWLLRRTNTILYHNANVGHALRFQACAQHGSNRPPSCATNGGTEWRCSTSTAAFFFVHVLAQPTMHARLAQSVERKALNLVVVGSSPTVGVTDIGARHMPPSDCTASSNTWQ